MLKQSEHFKADKPSCRIFTGIATIKGEKKGPPVNAKRHWCIVADGHSTLCFTNFYQTKNGMVERTLEIFNKLDKNGMVVKYVRCDNAGENKTLEKRSQGFSILSNKGRTMMHHTNVPLVMKYKVFPE
eukprot:10217613-Ditylum_brightwellii.AAC.1